MRNSPITRSLQPLLTALLITVLAISMVPVQTAQAQMPTTSDLAVSLVSLPKHVKACQTFEATYWCVTPES